MPSLRSPAARSTLLAVVVASAGAAAHDRGVLTLSARQVVPGSVVPLGGRQFSRVTSLRLVLVGTGVRIDAGTVRTDSAGRFADSLRVPPGTAAGSYRLVALASDGDEVAGLTLEVLAAPATSGPPPEDHAGHDEPTAAPLNLTRARSPVVTGGVLAVIALALAGAVALMRSSRSPHPGADS